MPPKPTGTVTLLFSDIEDSTSRLAELGAEQYNEALEEHRRILRDAAAKHAGHEFGAAGDALFIAFGSVQDSIRACKATSHRSARRASGRLIFPSKARVSSVARASFARSAKRCGARTFAC